MIIRACSVWPQKLNLNQEIKPQKRGFQLNRRSSEDRLVENELISFRGSELRICQTRASSSGHSLERGVLL